MDFLGAIEPEIWLPDRYGSAILGQSSTTRISDPIAEKKKISNFLVFKHENQTSRQIWRNSESVMSGDCVELTWNYSPGTVSQTHLLLKLLHLSLINFLHFEHGIEFQPAPFLHTLHGYLLELFTCPAQILHLIIFVFQKFTLSSPAWSPFLHLYIFSTSNSSDSAIRTKSSAYRSSYGKPSYNFWIVPREQLWIGGGSRLSFGVHQMSLGFSCFHLHQFWLLSLLHWLYHWN